MKSHIIPTETESMFHETLTRTVPLSPVFLTRTGLVKRKLTFEDKLDLLGQGAGHEVTLSRLDDYQRLFAYRYGQGIVTRHGKGPGAWTALRGPLGHEELVRHLLANRLPHLPPIWYGARSCKTSKYFCLDVDADRGPDQILAKKHDVSTLDESTRAALIRQVINNATRKPRPPFLDRCSLVERALRRLGMDPANPRSVLTLSTPSGGRHYFIFFDQPYFLDQYHALFQEAGLRHTPGQIEFFPSTTNGLRLPFGYLPGKHHDPHAWIQFIDDYRNQRIFRYSLQSCYESLAKHQQTQNARMNSRWSSTPKPVNPQSAPWMMGIPKHQHNSPTNNHHDGNEKKTQRYIQLLKGIHSCQEANELLSLGILVPGTRTMVLKHLASHLSWFKGLSAQDATQFLIDWCLRPGHVSKDIADDLAKGTTKVARQIKTMCNWYSLRKKTLDITYLNDCPCFSPKELDHFRPCLKTPSIPDRSDQAEFLLHFLRFAKCHGAEAIDGSGWDVAVAVRQVIRRWPGCSHMKYQDRVNHALSTGLIKVIKGPWHPSNGAGRATTYRLFIPVLPKIEWVMKYEAALEYLNGNQTSTHPGALVPTLLKKENTHAHDPSSTIPGNAIHPDPVMLPSLVHPQGSRGGLDLGP